MNRQEGESRKAREDEPAGDKRRWWGVGEEYREEGACTGGECWALMRMDGPELSMSDSERVEEEGDDLVGDG